MGSYRTIAFLAAFTFSLVNADYHYENYNKYEFDGAEEPNRKPWFLADYANGDGNNGRIQAYGSPAEAYSASSTKRVPNQDKNFKKAISPFYTLTEADDEKYKSIVLKSGAPYCQEIKSQTPGKRYRRDAMTCYKCKDPKNGATYERCSYTSQPASQESTRITARVPIAPSLRYRRSNVDGKQDEPGTEFEARFRFGDEYFAPAESARVPAEYKKNTEHCEKVIKDSMICMVCKDPSTNGKYEQCSYTNNPNEKAQGYSESSSYGAPKGGKDERGAKPDERRARGKTEAEEIPASEYAGEKYIDERAAAIKSRLPKAERTYGQETEESARLESGSESVEDASCRKVVKDTTVCTVCKDPKTGGNYEQCAYAYNPSDKVYQFSRSKKFGYPGESAGAGAGAGAAGVEKPQEEKDPGNGGAAVYYKPEKSEESQEYVPYASSPDSEHVKSESEKIAQQTKTTNCEKVQKDSMSCMICKDPKTGGNYEQCSYSYEPNDKVFSFSRAKSFGSPESGDKASYTGSGADPSPGYGETGAYGSATDSKPYAASEARYPRSGDAKAEKREKGEGKAAGIKDAGTIGIGYFDTSAKKKEIEKVLSEFQREDRSKCKKVTRDKLTCFQCAGDGSGEEKEECIFVAAQEPAAVKDRIAYREVKEFQRDPPGADGEAKVSSNERRGTRRYDSREANGKPVTSDKRKRKTDERSYNEPTISASENDERTAYDDEDEEDEEKENYEAESGAYDYAAATEPVYDKGLGLTLPRYMLQTSEHEIEFDEVVASTKT